MIFPREFFFHPFKYYLFIYRRLFENLKIGIPKSTGSETAQQAAQGKEVFYHSIFYLVTGMQQKPESVFFRSVER